MTPVRAVRAVRAVAVAGRSGAEEGYWTLRAAEVLRIALLLLAVANLGRLPVLDTGGREAPILLNDVAVGAVLVGGLAAMLASRRLVLDRVAQLALLFAGVGAFAAMRGAREYGLSVFELVVSLAYLARWLFYFGVYVVTTNVVRAGDVPALRQALVRTVLAVAGFGVIQAAFLPNFAQLIYPDSRVMHDWDAQAHRLVSTLLDPNFAGMLILMGLFVLLARVAAGLRVQPWQPTLLFAALLLTASRSSVLALLAGGAVIILVRGVSARVLRALAVGFALTLLALPGLLAFANAYHKLTIDESALGRVVMWFRGLQVIVGHPWLGIGFNTFGFVQERMGWQRMGANTYSIEGGLLFVTVMTGVVGLTVYALMLRAAWRNCRAVWRRPGVDAESWSLAVATAAITAALLVHSCFTNSLFLPYLMEPLWVLFGLVAVLRRQQHGVTGTGDVVEARATARVVALRN